MPVVSTKYNKGTKESSIYTPDGLCSMLYNISCKYITNSTIIDPSVGSGALLKYFHKNHFTTIGYDINNDTKRQYTSEFIHKSFLEVTDKKEVGLCIINPPFNVDKQHNKDYLKEHNLGRALLPQLFVEKCFSLYGYNVPLILITPMGFRLNQRKRSKRWRKVREEYPNITTIISLPLDIFENVEFHVEVLIWNLPQLKPHYFLDEEYLDGSFIKGEDNYINMGLF
jgi:Eco57I restriction-modification methylase